MATVDRGAIYVATVSFMDHSLGRPLAIRRRRTTVAEGHPLLRAYPDRFKPLVPTFDVEPKPTSRPTSTASPLQEFAALKDRAKALGLPVSGKKADLEAAIAAEERRRRED